MSLFIRQFLSLLDTNMANNKLFAIIGLVVLVICLVGISLTVTFFELRHQHKNDVGIFFKFYCKG